MIHLLLPQSDQKAGQSSEYGPEAFAEPEPNLHERHGNASYKTLYFLSYVGFLFYFFLSAVLNGSRLSRHGSERFG
ncbi:hypothetical protein DSECCO2_460730 [anaerobic digester metagenome]